MFRSVFGQDPRSAHGTQPAHWCCRRGRKESTSLLQDQTNSGDSPGGFLRNKKAPVEMAGASKSLGKTRWPRKGVTSAGGRTHFSFVTKLCGSSANSLEFPMDAGGPPD